MPSYIQVMTTVPSKRGAERIAEILVGKRLAACVQILGPAKSTYRWRGKIEKCEEWVCFIKTKDIHYEKIESEIKKIHKYDVPEIISFRIAKGNAQYMRWIGESLIR